MTRESQLQELKQRLLAVKLPEGYAAGQVPTAAYTRANRPQAARQCFYRPLIALVLQGRKRAVIGGIATDYGAGQCATVALDLPGVYHITEASDEEPFLSVSLQLDRQILTELITTGAVPPATVTNDPGPVITTDASDDLLDAFLRLVKLEESPARRSVLAPMIVREIHFLLLTGPQNSCLRHFCTNQPQTPRIIRALTHLKAHYTESLDITELADIAGMAPSTFHKHFKALTSLSPIQFQKRLRLHEAQRRMLTEGCTVETAAYAVGYESPSQFSHDYKRLFGSAPGTDIRRNRTSSNESSSVF